MTDSRTKNWFSLTSLFKGLGIAIMVSALLIFLTSSVFYFTPLSEQYASLASLAILFLSILLGGFFASKSTGTKGLMSGIVVAILFLSINLLLSITLGSSGIDFNSLVIKSAAILLGGAIGGVVGVGFSNN